MRPPTACVACRKRRRKCALIKPGQPCAHCSRRKVRCSFTLSPYTVGENGVEDDSSSSTSHVQLPSKTVCEEVVNLYFRYIHDTFHSLFHQPSLLEDVRDGTIPRIILLSIMSLSCRFSEDDFFTGTDPRTRGRPYALEAGTLLDLRQISVETIQACVLLGAFAITEGEAAAESLYYSVACRLAMLMDLPNIKVDTRLEQETYIRIWWSLSMIDVWSSNGVRLPRSIVPNNDVVYPMEEVIFLKMRRGEDKPPSTTTIEESSASLLTQMVKLNAILFEISEMHRKASNDIQKLKITAFELDASVDILGKKLDNWYANIPSSLKDTPENLERYASLGLGYSFVAVYLGYYHFGQLLYYHYLDEKIAADAVMLNDLSSRRATDCVEKCQFHSSALCEILYRSYATPGCEVYYTMVGHVLVIASTVQLFILLFSTEESEIATSRKRLEKNFEILTKLQTYWPTLDTCFTRFQEFHKACLDEKKANRNYEMDRWMSRFLFEFATPVTAKEAEMADSANQQSEKSPQFVSERAWEL